MSRTFKSSKYDLAVDTISSADIEELITWLRAYPRLTMAGETQRFEKAWAKWLGVKYGVMCNSGSSANLLMLDALHATGKIKKKTVVVPATGWATTVAPALQLNWNPVMCESDPRTFGLDMDALETILKRDRPEAVIAVHVLGIPVDMTRLLALQKKYDFIVMEDCCASHGACHQGHKTGTFGLISSFSFYYGHHMSTIEGGIVCTNNEAVYHRLLMLRSHGWLKDLPADKSASMLADCGMDPFHAPFAFVVPGYNLRPTDLNARMGLIQLRKLDETVARRVENHHRYQEQLKGLVGFAPGIPGDKFSSISFCAVARSPQERRTIVTALDKQRIDTRIFTAGNLGRHPFWSERFGKFSAPMADKLFNGGFFLPNNQSFTVTDIDFMCAVVREALKG